MSNMNKCLGCGISKQTKDSNIPGYVVNLDHKYCRDCFKLKNYGDVSSHLHPEVLPEIKQGSLVFIIQSVLHLDRLFMQPITRIQPKAKYVYIINQVDLLPESTNLDHLYNNIYKLARNNNIKLADVVFMSAIKKSDINNLEEYIMSFREESIYLFGIQNSGKTTIFKGLTGNSEALNLNKAGLTQNTIIDKLGSKTIHDMPGVYQEGLLNTFLSYDQYQNLIPSKTIKPRGYQLVDSHGLLIEDFINISYKGTKKTVVLYLSRYTKVFRMGKDKLESKLNTKYSYVTKTYRINHMKNQITFGDLGFMHIKGPTQVTIRAPKSLAITVTESLIK